MCLTTLSPPPPPPHHHHLSFSFDKDNLSSWVVFFFHPNPLVVESLDEMLAMASVIIWIILMGIMMTMLMLNKVIWIILVVIVLMMMMGIAWKNCFQFEVTHYWENLHIK